MTASRGRLELDPTFRSELQPFEEASLATERGPVVIIDRQLVVRGLAGGWWESWQRHGGAASERSFLGISLTEVMRAPDYLAGLRESIASGRFWPERYECRGPHLASCYPLRHGSGAVLIHTALTLTPAEGRILGCAYCGRTRPEADLTEWRHHDVRAQSHGICFPCRDFHFGGP